jgi:hypothetical protein
MVQQRAGALQAGLRAAREQNETELAEVEIQRDQQLKEREQRQHHRWVVKLTFDQGFHGGSLLALAAARERRNGISIGVIVGSRPQWINASNAKSLVV